MVIIIRSFFILKYSVSGKIVLLGNYYHIIAITGREIYCRMEEFHLDANCPTFVDICNAELDGVVVNNHLI